MQLFLSYSSHYREQADDICCRLQALGHEVFFDREDLPAGTSFDDLIRQAIESADMFIFLISPEAVEQGRYTRTELKLAQRKWPTPRWHVLPVMVAPTPFDDIPAYLRSLTLLQPEGNLTAEVVMEVEDRVRAHGDGAPLEPASPARTGTEGGYRSLSFRFSGNAQAGFAVHMAPGGETGDAPAITLDPAGLEHALWANAAPIAGTARRGSAEATPSRLPSSADARKIGQALYEALFDADRGEHLREHLRRLDPQKGDGLRFVIDTTEAPALARLPWEFIYSPQEDDFLFADRLKPIVRWLEVDAPPPSLAVTPPLRMLMAVAAPTDRPELAVGSELAQLDQALGELASAGLLETIRLEHTSLEQLDAAMLAHQPHVLHFIGHGDFVGDDGVLLLESDRHAGQAEAIAGRQLAVLLRNYRAHLRLVFLNSCMGAASAQGAPFGGVAQSLIRRGIPAVIAMQFPIPDEAAVALARHFYRYLAAGQPVDAALSSARAFLYARGYPVEWGAPALHMRAPDGRLFDLGSPSAAAVAPPTAGAPPARPAASPAPMPTPDARGGRSPWLIVGLVLVAVGLGFAAWLAMSPAAKDVPSGTEPPPEVRPPSLPPPMVEPPAITTDAAIDTIIGKLERDDWAGARAELGAMLDAADPTLTDALEAGRRNDLLSALDGAIARADAAGNTAEADALGALLARLLPDEPVMVPEPSPVIEPPAIIEETSLLASATTLAEQNEIEAALSTLEALSDVQLQEERALMGDTELEALLSPLASAAAQGGADTAARIVRQLERLAPEIAWSTILAPTANIEPAAGGQMPGSLYRVRRGDTLWGLSQRFLGDGAAWPEFMQRHNTKVEIGFGGDLIRHPDRLAIGQQLHLPMGIDAGGREQLQYRVAPGDTLSGIAWRIYGDAALWPQIVRENPGAISHPDRLFVGQVLTLTPPARHH